MLDTPGILWPKFEDQTVGLRLAFIGSIDIRGLAVTVMHKLFAMLEMKYDFKLSTDGETEERR